MRTISIILAGLLAAACSDGSGFGGLGGGKSNDGDEKDEGSIETEDQPTTIPQDVSGSYLTDCVAAADGPVSHHRSPNYRSSYL